jgi:hypothetical protein
MDDIDDGFEYQIYQVQVMANDKSESGGIRETFAPVSLISVARSLMSPEAGKAINSMSEAPLAAANATLATNFDTPVKPEVT